MKTAELIEFDVQIKIPTQMVKDLLVCAFEGGSNYWYDDLNLLKRTSKARCPSDRFYENIMKHGFSLVNKETGNQFEVVPNSFKSALQKMHSEYSKHFQDVQNDSTDADTGDVFLQLLVFGKVVYG